MNVELHLHTSRYSGCAQNTPAEMMRGLIEAGYDAVFLTEHNTIWEVDELAGLQAQFPQIRIFGGVELSFDMQHLLVLGTTDPAFLAVANASEAIEKAREANLATVLAHPFRWAGGADMLDEGLRPDAIEYLTWNQQGESAGLALDASQRLELPLVNAGDIHAVEMIGGYWIETFSNIEKPTDLHHFLQSGEYRNCRQPK